MRSRARAWGGGGVGCTEHSEKTVSKKTVSTKTGACAHTPPTTTATTPTTPSAHTPPPPPQNHHQDHHHNSTNTTSFLRVPGKQIENSMFAFICLFHSKSFRYCMHVRNSQVRRYLRTNTTSPSCGERNHDRVPFHPCTPRPPTTTPADILLL